MKRLLSVFMAVVLLLCILVPVYASDDLPGTYSSRYDKSSSDEPSTYAVYNVSGVLVFIFNV